MTDKITAVFIIEAIGRPADHLKSVLQDIVSKFKQEKNAKVISDKVMESKQVPDQENLFSNFAEIEFETELHALMLLIFGYMPSHIEIITPELVKLENSTLNVFLNELVRKLHQYDEIAKAFILEKRMLQEKIKRGEIIVKDQKSAETASEKKPTRKPKNKK